MYMQIFQVDAFTKELFEGNPAAVVPLSEWLPDDLMQRIAMENNLAETVYFVPEGDKYMIRWFTPTVEVDLCGHATLAAGQVLFEEMGFKGEKINFYSPRSGLLEVSKGKQPGQLTLNFPAGAPTPVNTPVDIIFEGLGIPPQPLFKGPYDYMIVLENEAQILALQPDFRRLAASPGRGVVVTAPGSESDFVSRCFFPQSGIDEDPVTGSAHTMLTPYWAQRLGKKQLSAIQLSARRGHLDCELAGDRVYISGYAKIFLKGNILPGPDDQPSLTIRKAQNLVDRWIRTTGVRYFSELTNMAILTEEVGEVARLMSRLYGDQSFKESDKDKDLADELADVLWVLICIANQTGIDLTTALEKNFTKKNIRDATRHQQNAKLK
jgi:PhzF family phenazine biosynthesis protein